MTEQFSDSSPKTSPMQRRQLLAGAGAVLALTVAGCTGSDSPSSDPTDTTSPSTTGTDTTTSSTPTESSTSTSTSTETTTEAAPASAVDVSGTDAAREGDGELTIEYRPVTFQAFTWDGADGQFYEANPGERYLIVQLRLAAADRALEVDLRNFEGVVDGEPLGRQAFTGELKVSSPIEPDAPVSGWRAWSLPESIDEVTLQHTADSRTYTTTIEHAADLDLGVSEYEQ